MAATIKYKQHGAEATYTNVKDTFPASSSVAGTVTSYNDNRRIVGSGTSFTDLQVGDYLYNATLSECRKIEWIYSDTELTLSRAFSSALSGSTVKSVKPIYKLVSYVVDSAGSVVIDGITIPASTSNTKGTMAEEGQQVAEPIVFDSTSNSNTINITAEA